VNYSDDNSVDFIKGTHINHDMYKDIQFIHDKKTCFYEVICTKYDNSECHVYIGYDGAAARRTYNRIIASANDSK
jgi:hypothetical protein